MFNDFKKDFKMEPNETLNGNSNKSMIDLFSFFDKEGKKEKTKCQFVGKKGLEPPTLRLSSVYSNQLSYLPFLSFFFVKKKERDMKKL